MARLQNSLYALSMFVASSLCGSEECPKPCAETRPESCCQSLPEAYNSSARISSCCPYNLYTELSFNYWQPAQENMEVGLLSNGASTTISLSGPTTVAVASADSSRAINMHTDFKPGFTIGLGVNFDYDSWDLRVQYTWFHNTSKKNETASDFVIFNPNSQNIAPTWGSLTSSEVGVVYQFASEKWNLGMDLLDLDLGRWFYVGSKLTFHPSFGIRAAFIQQKVHVSYTNGFTDYIVDVPGLLGEGVLVENKNVFSKSHSWGIGPKAALETHWLLGRGFRLFGNGEADVIYTRYTSLKGNTVTTGTVVGIINFVPFSFTLNDDARGKQRNVGCLRTHLDLELGVGWGTYLKANNLYIDCSAGYDFQVFFDQNMLRRNVTDTDSSLPNGNLYVQGLIAKARLDF